MAPPPLDGPLPPHLTAHFTKTLPQNTLASLLSQRTTAATPKTPTITAATPTTLTIDYFQPVREYWWSPVPHRVIFTIPSLPTPPTFSSPTSLSAAPTTAEVAYAEKLSARLCELVDENEGEPVAHFAAPRTWGSWVTILVFAAFTLAIVMRIMERADVFGSDRRFNVAVLVHAAVLVKRSGDASRLNGLVKRHWKGGWAGRVMWGIAGWVEGWRAVVRFLEEVEGVRKELVKEKVGAGKKRDGEVEGGKEVGGAKRELRKRK